MKKNIKPWILSALAVFLASAFSPLFLYFQNADEADFTEIVPALLILVGVGAGIFLVCALLTRKPGKAGVSATLFVLIFDNFAFLEKGLKLIVPQLKYWHTVTIVAVIGLHIAFLLWRFLKEDTSKSVTSVICLVFAGLIVVNCAMGMPKIVNRLQAKSEIKNNQPIDVNGGTEAQNIYLIIFDEYSNFPQMKEYYNYNNKPLKTFLTENNFTISYTGHNESIISSTIQTNLVNLDYIVDNYTSESEKEALRKNGRLFSLMRENGYNIQIYETKDFYGGTMPTRSSNNTDALTMGGENLQQLVLKNTLLYPFFKINAADFLKDINDLVDYWSTEEAIPKEKTFTLIYVPFPHAPFVADENGNAIPSSGSANWADNKYYLGQFKYATKLMIRIANNLIENDPDSIIMLQSDHGARAADERAEFMEKFPLDVMNNFFNALYYPDGNVNIEGLSSVNTLRAVLNDVLGMNFEMLSVPIDNYKYK